MDPKNISAVIVTKGGRDLAPILKTLEPFDEVIVWDNSMQDINRPEYANLHYIAPLEDHKVYGRYCAALSAKHDTIYVQDDDCLIDPLALLALYTDKMKVLCNMTEKHSAHPYYKWRIKLVGFGAFFQKSMVNFDSYTAQFPMDDLFMIECDRAFTALNVCVEAHVPITQMPYSGDQDRLWRLPDHGTRMQEINRRMRHILGESHV